MKIAKLILITALCFVFAASSLTASAAYSGLPAGASFVFHVVDESGKSVKALTGMLELGIATEYESPPGAGLVGNGPDRATGADGNLYFTDPASHLPQKGTLILTAQHDRTMRQRVVVDFSAAEKEITVTWQGTLPPSQAPNPATRRITFRIVDEEGKPVANVYGALDYENDMASGRRIMSSFADKEIPATDESGVMYIDLEPGWEKESNRKYILHLHAYYDYKMAQEYRVTLPDPPASYRIVWKQGTPPKERPPQTTGIRIFMVDILGRPVQGVEMFGSPYPKEKTGIVPDIGMILGPSDEKGYIRWDDVEPGTYELYGGKDGKSQQFTLKKPKDKAMVDVTLVWNPPAE